MEERLYTPEDLAGLLQISKYTVYELIKRGQIPAHHIGKQIRVSKAQLDQYLISSDSTDNVFLAEIVKDDRENDQFALIGSTRIYVGTEFSGKAKICIPPEDIIISLSSINCSARNILNGTIETIEAGEKNAKILINAGIPLYALITVKSMEAMDLRIGTEVYAIFKTMAVKVVR